MRTTKFLTVQGNVFARKVGQLGRQLGRQLLPHPVQGRFQRPWFQARKNAAEGVVVGNAIVQTQREVTAQVFLALSLCPILDVLEAFGAATKGGQSHKQDVGQAVQTGALHTRVR